MPSIPPNQGNQFSIFRTILKRSSVEAVAKASLTVENPLLGNITYHRLSLINKNRPGHGLRIGFCFNAAFPLGTA